MDAVDLLPAAPDLGLINTRLAFSNCVIPDEEAEPGETSTQRFNGTLVGTVNGNMANAEFINADNLRIQADEQGPGFDFSEDITVNARLVVVDDEGARPIIGDIAISGTESGTETFGGGDFDFSLTDALVLLPTFEGPSKVVLNPFNQVIDGDFRLGVARTEVLNGETTTCDLQGSYTVAVTQEINYAMGNPVMGAGTLSSGSTSAEVEFMDGGVMITIGDDEVTFMNGSPEYAAAEERVEACIEIEEVN